MTSLNTRDHVDATIRRHIDDRVFGGHGTWRPLAAGSINDVWQVTSDDGIDVVVRIGPSAEVVRQGPSWMRANALGCEQHLLALVRPHFAQVPATVAAGFLPGGHPWVAQELVPGVPLSEALAVLSPNERDHIWRAVGSLLRWLQVVPAPWFGTPDGSERFPDWPSMVANDAARLVEDARLMGLPLEPFSVLSDRVQRHYADLAIVDHPSVVHSDLDPRHIFVDCGDDGWRIGGVIDWEYGRYADPNSEGLLIDMIDRHEDDPARIAFLDGYGPVDASPPVSNRRMIYRGIGLGWELTDAVRCNDKARRDTALVQFRRWADG